MKRVIALAAVLALAGCGEKKAESTPASNAAPAPAMADSMPMSDSTMARDTSHSM